MTVVVVMNDNCRYQLVHVRAYLLSLSPVTRPRSSLTFCRSSARFSSLICCPPKFPASFTQTSTATQGEPKCVRTAAPLLGGQALLSKCHHLLARYLTRSKWEAAASHRKFFPTDGRCDTSKPVLEDVLLPVGPNGSS